MNESPITNYRKMLWRIRREHFRVWLKHEGPFIVVTLVCVFLICAHISDKERERVTAPWLNGCEVESIKEMSSTDGEKQTMTISCEVRK